MTWIITNGHGYAWTTTPMSLAEQYGSRDVQYGFAPRGILNQWGLAGKWVTEFPGQEITIIMPHVPTDLELPPGVAWHTTGPVTGPTVHWGFTDRIGTDDPIIRFRLAGPDRIVEILRDYHAATGVHYRYTPGVAALAAIRHSVKDYQPRWILNNHTVLNGWWEPPGKIGDIALPTPRYRGKAPTSPLHRWDMRSAYLAAAAAVDLPKRELRPTGVDVDPKKAVGYFRLMLGNEPKTPWWLRRIADEQFCVWVCHPVMQYLDAAGLSGVLVDSWTVPEGRRYLRAWAERFRDAQTNPALAPAIKAGYAQAIGLFTRKGGTIYRPDWRHIIIDQMRASLGRRFDRVHQLTGLTPTRVDHDSVWYHTDRPDQVGEALGVGDQIGRMRYEGPQ